MKFTYRSSFPEYLSLKKPALSKNTMQDIILSRVLHLLNSCISVPVEWVRGTLADSRAMGEIGMGGDALRIVDYSDLDSSTIEADIGRTSFASPKPPSSRDSSRRALKKVPEKRNAIFAALEQELEQITGVDPAKFTHDDLVRIKTQKEQQRAAYIASRGLKVIDSAI